ncbi:Rab3 GTPase-activating protein catalytic subunit [Blomia tropicalis]|nr:Rab3 GTPase-activating protein catalytic subunit [Blomia tropicalis]
MSEEEVFEINDYSTASEWERFISDLEELLTQWNLASVIDDNISNEDESNVVPKLKTLSINESLSSKLFSDPHLWIQKKDQLKFGKVAFTLTFYTFKNNVEKESSVSKAEKTSTSRPWYDMNSTIHDWAHSGHPLIRYYGLTQFLLLCPLNSETISSEDRIRHLLGSAAIAMNNINCEVPFFCQICQPSRNLFSGVLNMNDGFRTYFDMIQLNDVPQSFQYLSELIVLFKKKLYSTFSYSSLHRDKSNSISDDSRIVLSIRFTYLLSIWPPQYLLFNGNSPNHPSLQSFSYFRSDFNTQELLFKPMGFGLVANQYSDPLKQLQLATTWPIVAEELITDNSYHTDLHPRNAPRWSLRALFSEQNAQTNKLCHMTEWLRTFIHLRYQYKLTLLQKCSYTTNDANDQSEMDVRSALDRLTNTSPNSLLHASRNVFGQLEKNFFSFDSNLSNANDMVRFAFSEVQFDIQAEEKYCGSLKSAPIGSLSWRISCLLANSFAQQQQIATVAVLWNYFVEKLRSHWEECNELPFIDSPDNDSIDFANCLFHQKLQMLNCCIRQKIKRERSSLTVHINENDKQENQCDDEEEEEFFDCDEDGPTEQTESNKPEGQLKILTDTNGKVINRIKVSNKPIYVPITQDCSPMTEDQHNEQIKTLASMGNTVEDQKLKLRLQSSSLLSDMEAFKAANPDDPQFEDFIRWHSPRDWIELDDNEKNTSAIEFGLSRRMRDSSVWTELWDMARPIPVSRQKRLFNYTKDAEQILHYFENISVDQVIEMLGPILAKATIDQILRYRDEIITFVNENVTDCDDIVAKLLSFDFNVVEMHFNRSDYDGLCQTLFSIEYEIIKFYSVLKKIIFAYESEVKKPFKDLYDHSTTSNQTNSTKNVGIKQAGLRTGPNRGVKIVSRNNVNDLSLELTKFKKSDLIRIVIQLLLEPDFEFSNTNCISSLVVRLFADSNQFHYESTTSVGDRIRIEQDVDNEDFDADTTRSKTAASIPQLPSPSGKEFIFRTQSIARPAPYSRPSSQRLYCLMRPKFDFRIATAFTEDIAYF